ncbi:MAG: protein kinase [Pirellulaceae bacterium]|nr:protein kinase [Pirellulaceae bacterium]
MRREDPMSQEDIDERLVDWELARQRGEEIDAAILLADVGPWRHYLQQRIEVLSRTSWMLEDPVPAQVAPWISKLVSQTEGTVKNSVAVIDTPSSGSHSEQYGSSDAERRATLGLPHQMPDVPGFRYVAQQGKGGFGVVFRALDENLQREVAIKFPLIDGLRERQRYVAEARNASRVEAAGIVPIYYVGETHEGTPFVVQKLIDGKSLHEILKFGGVLSPSQTIELFTRICQAVAAAHAQALVHRDLKPENILIDKQGYPWIADFGLSLAEDDPKLPQASVAGTPCFMSPEQIMGKAEWLDGRCDIWALGVMLYQCLTGRLPFQSDNTTDLHDKILNLEPRPIAQRQPTLGSEWDTIFRKCCAKSISERYNSALEMAQDLDRLSRSLEPSLEKHNALLQKYLGSTLSSGRKTSTEDIARWRKIRRNAMAAWGLGAVALLIIVAFFRQGPAVDEFVVSPTGHGTHRTIQAALDAANSVTSIFIEPGLYHESLVLKHKITLRGRGPRDQIQIVGSDGPAFQVDIGGQLALYGLSVAVDETTTGIWNAIDVTEGAVLLEDCSVSANEFDCVRLQAESSLIATNCDFYNTLHPAIYSKLAEHIEVAKSRFHIGLDEASQTKFLAGMQIEQSGGTVSDCSFTGSSAVGIEWSHTRDVVTIDNCQFENLERAIIATTCQELQIGGDGRALFKNCNTAMELTGCGGAIKNCQIDDLGNANGKGLMIKGLGNTSAPIVLQSCQIDGARVPLVLSQSSAIATSLTIDGCSDMGIRLLDNSYLELNASQIRNCEVAGLLLEGSRAVLQRCVVSSNQAAGIVVDGLDDALVAKSCQIHNNQVGILVLSGAARLEHTDIQRTTTGILLARRHKLAFAATCDAQLTLQTLGGKVEASQSAILFLSPGSYRLTDCHTSDPDDRPVLDEKLERVDGINAVIVRLKVESQAPPAT